MERTQLAFQLLESLCRRTRAADDRLLPIEFEVETAEGPASLRYWNLDPERQQPLFAPGRHAAPALRVRCTPQLLLSWAFPRAGLRAGPPRLVGQLEALRRLARVVAPGGAR